MTTTRPAPFPGWRMVRALAITEAISYGVLFYAFAVMLVPMRESFGAGTGEISLALTISLAVTGIAAVPAGRWLDRRGARGLMTSGSLLGAASVVGWSQARTLPQLYLAFAAMGLAGAAVLYEPAFAVINTWFREDRQRALLTLTVIAGFSSTVFVPLCQVLVDAFGWRTAVLVLAAMTGACSIPHALLLRRAPEDLGPHPDGRITPLANRAPPPAGPSPRASATLYGRSGDWRRALFALPGPVGITTFVLLFGAGFGVMTLARPALLGTYVGSAGFASVSGAQTLAITAGRVLAPISAGTLIVSAGYGVAFAGVAACCVGAAILIMLAHRAALIEHQFDTRVAC